MPPSEGSITTAAPATGCSEAVAAQREFGAQVFVDDALQALASIVVTSVLPGTGSTGLSRRTSTPEEFTSICWPPEARRGNHWS